MYKKAWLTLLEDSSIGIGYMRNDGIHGKLMKLLSDEDLQIIEARLRDVLPFSRS